jgi:hypothetical protein
MLTKIEFNLSAPTLGGERNLQATLKRGQNLVRFNGTHDYHFGCFLSSRERGGRQLTFD